MQSLLAAFGVGIAALAIAYGLVGFQGLVAPFDRERDGGNE